MVAAVILVASKWSLISFLFITEAFEIFSITKDFPMLKLRSTAAWPRLNDKIISMIDDNYFLFLSTSDMEKKK